MKRLIRKYKFLTLLIGVITIGLASCSEHLDEDPYTSLTEEEVYGDEENLRLLISGLYTQWRNTRQERSPRYFVLGSDEGKQGGQQVLENNVQAALDKYNGAMNPSNSTMAGEWEKRWPVVSAAANAIFYSPNEELKAQASFIRATINFDLVMLWGPIPIIDLEDMRESRQ